MIQKQTMEDILNLPSNDFGNNYRLAITEVVITYKTMPGVKADLVKPKNGDPYLTPRGSNQIRMSNTDTQPTAMELCRRLEGQRVWRPYRR